MQGSRHSDCQGLCFVTAEGSTIAVLTLESGDIRPMDVGEILHTRALAGSETA